MKMTGRIMAMEGESCSLGNDHLANLKLQLQQFAIKKSCPSTSFHPLSGQLVIKLINANK